MIDTLLKYKERALSFKRWETFQLPPKGYGVVTLHRPSNVDDAKRFLDIVQALVEIQDELPLIFPVHMRTQKNMDLFGFSRILSSASHLMLTEPMGYLDFLSLLCSARMVLTDSGGIQEETTFLGIPCLTLRENTERPITLTQGTNQLVKPERETIVGKAREILNGRMKIGTVPEMWDGKSSERILAILAREFVCAKNGCHS